MRAAMDINSLAGPQDITVGTFVGLVNNARSVPGGVEAGGNAIAKRPAFNSASACLGDTKQEKMITIAIIISELMPRSCIQIACGDG